MANLFSPDVVIVINGKILPSEQSSLFSTANYWTNHFSLVTLSNFQILDFEDKGERQFSASITFDATNNQNGQSSQLEVSEWWLEDNDGKVVYWNRHDDSGLMSKFYNGGVTDSISSEYEEALELMEGGSPTDAIKMASLFSCDVIVVINDILLPSGLSSLFCTADYWNDHFSRATLSNFTIIEFDSEGEGQYSARVSCFAENQENGHSSVIELSEWWLEDTDGLVVYWNRQDDSNLLQKFIDGGINTVGNSSAYANALALLEDGSQDSAVVMASLFSPTVVIVINGKLLPSEQSSLYSTVKYWTDHFSLVTLSNITVISFEDLGQGQFSASMSCEATNNKNGKSSQLEITEWWLEDSDGKIVYWNRQENSGLMSKFYGGLNRSKPLMCKNRVTLS